MTEKDVYICACSETGGLYHFKLNADGGIRFCSVAALDRPMYAALEDDRLYVLLRAPFRGSEHSGVAVLPVEEDGRPGGAKSLVSTGGTVSAHLCVRGGEVYTANYVSGDITKLPDKTVSHQAYSPAGGGAHPHFIGFTPDGKYIAVADLGLDSVFVYDPELAPVSSERAPAGSGCRHLAFSPDGKYAFCANEHSSDVSVFAYSDGRFRLINTYKALPEDRVGATYAAAIRCADDLVYVSHRGYDAVTVFSHNGGVLEKRGDIPCGGAWPRDFAVWGDILVCTNEKSDSVTVIRGGKVLSVHTLPSPIAVLIK